VVLLADGYAVVISLARRVLLHRFNFKGRVRDVQFSPDDSFIAVTHGRKVNVWRSPSLRREFAPFVLHRTFTGHFDDVTCVSWSPCSR
jgi:periodic tryptophan protein 2